MHIGELAERSNLSLRTIRHYDQVGLLRPSARTDGGFRVYSENDYQRLLMIRQARALDFSLEEIGLVLDLLNVPASTTDTPPANDAQEQLAPLLAEAITRRQALATDLSRADDFIAIINERVAS